MASTISEIKAAFERGDGNRNPGFYDAHIPTPGRKGPKNIELAFLILDGSFFGWNKLPPELQNLREGVITPCCDILDTPQN